MDRKYLHSNYLREPAGGPFETVKGTADLTVDEAVGQLGEQLMLPVEYAASHEQPEATPSPAKRERV